MTIPQWLGKYWGFLPISVGVFAWFYAHNASNLMDQRAKYTIGYITGYRYQYKSGKRYEFRFATADSTYKGDDLSDRGMATANGSRFLVKYDSVSPGTNVGYFALAIPDSIKQVPPRGWLMPPISVPAWILKRGEKAK